MLILGLHLLCLGAALSCQNPLNPRLVPAGRGGSVVLAQDTVLAGRDTYISKTLPNQNFGSSDTLRTGGPNRNRALLAFDSAAIAQVVGSGQLDSAWLELTIVLTDGLRASGRTFDLHRLLSNWTELGATWNCPVDTNTSNESPDCTGSSWDMTNGNAYASGYTARVTVVDQQTGVLRLNVTSDVAGILSGTGNYGWLFRKTNESLSGGTVTFSRNNPASAPRLVLRTVQSIVPAQPPDTIPAWVYADTNISSGSSHIPTSFVKSVVVVLFRRSATQAERQAAIDAVGGEVVGGRGAAWGNGMYIVRIADPGDGSALVGATNTLRSFPYVLSASVDGFLAPDYLTPKDGQGWRSWQLSPALADSENWALEAVAAPLAWGCSIGDSTVPVALIDLGFQNYPEVTRNAVLRYGTFTGPDSNATKEHGTYVASILAARGNDDSLLTGVMWRGDLRLYDYGSGSPGNPQGKDLLSEAVDLVARAATDGARIINISSGLRWNTPTEPSRADTTATRRVRDYAEPLAGILTDLRDVGVEPLIVLSAGNEGFDAYWNALPAAKNPENEHQILVVGAVGKQGPTWFLWPKSGNGTLVDILAPGVGVYGLNGLGAVESDTGTSAAAPIVSGIAGLILSANRDLNASQLKSYVVQGAGRGGLSQAGVSIANAYESLRVAAETPGEPLCGNRVWAEGKVIYAQRAGSAQAIFTATDTVGLLNPYHGGRRIDFVENGVGDVVITYQNGTWQRVSDPSSLSPGFPNATWNSLNGMPHDGDSVAVASQSPSAGGVTVTLSYGTPFSLGRTVGTLPVPLLASSTTTCGTMVAQHDSTGAFTGYQCTSQIPDGSFETASSRTTVPPMGGRIFLLVNRFYNQSLGVTDSLLCPGTGLDAFGNMNCYNRVVTYDQTSERADVYEFPIQGGTGVMRWARNLETLHWFGISENSLEGVEATSHFVGGVPTNCSIAYLDPQTGGVFGTPVPNPVACSARGTGGIADIRMASVRLPVQDLDSPPKPRHWRR